MGSLKKFVSVVVLVYLLLAALFFLVPAVRTTVAEWGQGTSPADNERNFFQVLSIIGFVVLAAQLVVDSVTSGLLHRTVSQQESKINELKAKLYDHHNSVAAPAAPAPAVSYPTAAEAAATQPRPEAPLS